MVKRFWQRVFPVLCAAVFFGMGTLLAQRLGHWAAALAVTMLLTAVAACLLPGPFVLWTELLGTASAFPVIWHVMPMLFFKEAFGYFPVVFELIYGLVCLMIATLAPMMVLLLYDQLATGL